MTSWGASPELAMGLDGALLEGAEPRPALRLYTWTPDTLSLGYFQRFADVPGTSEASRVVRRVTGGGAIHHCGELTFSITAPLTHPLYRGPVGASYERVHAAIIEALAGLGVAAELCGEAPLDSDRADTGMCFHASTPLDLVWNGRKGVGSAQRRSGGRVLHHGSIKLDTSPLEVGVATAAGTPQEVGVALAEALARRAECTFEDAEPTGRELERASELGARAAHPDFVRRR